MTTRFHSLDIARSPVVFALFEAKPSAPNSGFYAGVLITQKGPAKGHYAVKDGGRVVNFDAKNPAHAELQKYPIVIGDETLDDVARCGAEEGTTKCKLDHGATIKDIVGSYSSFKRSGDQVRADLTLMNSSSQRSFVEELFANFSKKVGNSIDFDYRYEIQGSVAVARCVKLNSVDIVDAPAATNSLFNENPNPTPTQLTMTKEELEQLTGVINGAVNTAIETRFKALETGINTRLGKIETTVTKLEEGADDDKKDKEKKNDDDKSAMSAANIQKAVLSSIREIFPKATVDNLNSLAAGGGANKDEYADKHAAAMSLGMTGPQATKFMATKHPALYTAKFGNGGGQKGSAATSTKL